MRYFKVSDKETQSLIPNHTAFLQPAAMCTGMIYELITVWQLLARCDVTRDISRDLFE